MALVNKVILRPEIGEWLLTLNGEQRGEFVDKEKGIVQAKELAQMNTPAQFRVYDEQGNIEEECDYAESK